MQYYTIIAGSPITDPTYIKDMIHPKCIIICADGGANIAHEINVKPHIIIGDFDSISNDVLAHFKSYKDISITPSADQNTTDLQKALNLIRDDCTHISIFGALGGRMDHVLANILLLEQYKHPMRFTLHDEDHDIRIITNDFTFSGQVGDKVGVLPLRPIEKLTYDGLKYPADGIEGPYTLGWLGTSNVLEKEQATIYMQGGAAILIHYKVR